MNQPGPGSGAPPLLANPIQVIIVVVVLGGIVVSLNSLSNWLMPVIFVACLTGMAAVAVTRLRAERREQATHAVDYARLASIKTQELPTWLKDNVRGHDSVVEDICLAIRKNVQLARPGRTLGNFLLVGPTGTGKTFLSQLVSAAVFPDSEPVLLTMNQYKQPGDVYTLIGPPPGMPGYEVGGRLTRPVLENPYRVIIFDELEKAHHDLHDCLYNILDTASCIEKSSGRPVDFSGCLFFATCNAGVEKLRALAARRESSSAWLGQSRDALAESAAFDRAFLSRWDGLYLMDQLPLIHVAEVACLQLARHWREYGIEVGYAAPELILDAVKRNADFAQYGVRQLGRYIRERTEPAILDAKRRGVAKVSLAVADEAGGLVVEVPQ
jgi:ATP-dependent Clp protease ATP-binding subunit ClpC